MNSKTLIHRYLLGEATPAEVRELEQLLAKDQELRRTFLFEAGVDAELREIALERVADEAGSQDRTFPISRQAMGAGSLFPIAAAACLAFLLGLALMFFRGSPEADDLALDANLESSPQPSAEGFAVMGNVSGARWAPDENARRKGDTLGAEVLRLNEGIAEVQFFSGATMVIQGPAEIELKSAWEASCLEGSVRMRVPPAARGFRLQGPSTEIVDLGTEFGFQVREGKAHVEVIDGEISIRHRNGVERLAAKGAAWELPDDGAEVHADSGSVAFPELNEFDGVAQSKLREDFERWKVHSRALARDERVIAYYTFDDDRSSKVVPSLAQHFDAECDGAVVLAETAAGRWPEVKKALEFRRPGSRVRVRIPGEFQALTFAAWVRIDSLDRRYNALFMGDGYETGEPHWQIRDDGKLMLSVMVDDSAPHPQFPDVNYHHVYFSPSMWDLSMSGQWVHLASVFDPENRAVSHYVNGKRISRERIEPSFLVRSLRIGNGEIGNWGQPLRETPWFAIRNLNGRIDELAILNAALTDDEISNLHHRSQAQHY